MRLRSVFYVIKILSIRLSPAWVEKSTAGYSGGATEHVLRDCQVDELVFGQHSHYTLTSQNVADEVLLDPRWRGDAHLRRGESEVDLTNRARWSPGQSSGCGTRSLREAHR